MELNDIFPPFAESLETDLPGLALKKDRACLQDRLGLMVLDSVVILRAQAGWVHCSIIARGYNHHRFHSTVTDFARFLG
jgi:hypothetical protein